MKSVILIIGAILIVILSHLILRYGFSRKLERFSEKLRKELPWLVACPIVWVWLAIYTCIVKVAEGKDPAIHIVTGAVCAFLCVMRLINLVKEELQDKETAQKAEEEMV